MNRRTVISGLAVASVLPLKGWAQPATALNLAALEARHGGRLGVCAETDAKRVTWRADERFAYCSTFKLFLAACVMERVQRGLDKLDRPIPITRNDMTTHAPVTEPAVGATLTIEQLCKATVEISDNPAANILIREMGGIEMWRAWYQSIGSRPISIPRCLTIRATRPHHPSTSPT